MLYIKVNTGIQSAWQVFIYKFLTQEYLTYQQMPSAHSFPSLYSQIISGL